MYFSKLKYTGLYKIMQTIFPYCKTFLQRKYFRKQLVPHAEGKNEEKSVSKQKEF